LPSLVTTCSCQLGACHVLRNLHNPKRTVNAVVGPKT
jgi:hypothetical protein